MYDDLHPDDAHDAHDAHDGLGFQLPAAPSPSPSPSRVPGVPASDREVPLPVDSPALLHQWLDGDVKVAVMRATPGGNETVDLWTKIHDEAETLRSRTTPLYVHKRIMESLPDDAYKLQRPWYRRGMSINPVALLAAAAALMVAGAVVAHVAFR